MDVGRTRSDPSDELRPLTAVFADVVGSTSLGEKLSAGEVKALIGECVSRMCASVERYGGVVTGYMGDGIAAFFGLEGALEDGIERGARAALEIREAIATYAGEVERTWGIAGFNVRIGVNHGRAAVGAVGAGDPRVMALGDPVNVAARLQSAAAPGEVVVSEDVARVLSSRYALRSLGSISVKGRAIEVSAFELSGRIAQPPTSNGPFVGRRAELRDLFGVMDEVCDGHGQVALVVGEGGIGKTRLVEELRLKSGADVLWLSARCDGLEVALPYEPFAQAVRSWLGVTVESPPLEVRVRLLSQAKELLGEEFGDVVPHLAGLLGLSLEPRLDRRLEGFPLDVHTSSLCVAYRTWLNALATINPVVLALDNLDTASERTAEFGTSLFDAVYDAPILIIATTRRSPGSPGWRFRVAALADHSERTRELSIGALSDDEALELVRALDSDSTLNAGLQNVVVRRAEGNPLFIEELVATVSADTEEELPSALESLLLSRIDALPPEVRSTLQSAAVLGRVFRRESVVRMHPSNDVGAAIASLLRSDILREAGREPLRYAFRHGLYRDAAVATLPDSALRGLHEAAARALEADCGDDVRELDAVARHFLAAGLNEAALVWFERLADHMIALSRLREALDLVSLCLELAEDDSTTLRLAMKKAEVLQSIGQIVEALQLIDRAESANADPGELIALALVKAKALSEAGRFAEASDLLQDMLVRDPPQSVIDAARMLRGRLALETGDITTAEAESEYLLRVSLGTDGEFEALSLRAGVAALRGDLATAETYTLRSEEIAGRSGHLARQLKAKRHSALICLLKGCVREAYALTAHIYRQCADLGYVVGQLENGTNVVHLGTLVGELADAIRVGEEILSLSNGEMWEAPLRVNLANARFEHDDCGDNAMSLVDPIIRENRPAPDWIIASARIVRAEVYKSTGRLEDALREVRLAREATEKGQSTTALAFICTTQAEIELARGLKTDAVASTERARACLVGAEQSDRIRVDRICSFVEGACGSPGARARLQRVVSDAQGMGLRLDEAHARMGLALLDTDNAERHFADAERIFGECGSKRGLLDVEAARRGALIASAG